jgi:hypothetical protein
LEISVKEGYEMVLRRGICSGVKGIGLLLAGLLPLFLFPMAFAQEIQWIRQFGTENRDSAEGVSVDMAGNVYVVGWTWGTLPGQKEAGNGDAFVRKYDGNGNEIWTRQFGSEWDDSANGVSVDKAGNVYVVGFTGRTPPGQEKPGEPEEDAFIAKFGPRPTPRIEEFVLCAPHPVGKEGCVFFLKIPENAVHAILNIYSVNGALILSIPIDPSKDRYPITGKWVPQDNNGRPLGSGIYFYLVKVRYSDGRIERSKVQKLVIKR